MRLYTFVAAALLAAGLPLVSFAQTPGATPRFYAGLGASLLTDAPFVDSGSSTILGPALAAGVRLSPRWAVQAGAALAWRNQTESPYSAPGVPASVAGTLDTHTATLLVPVLARYTFAPAPTRFHVEALGGLTVLRAATRYVYTATPPASTGQPPYQETRRRNVITGNISLGPGVRYALAPHVDITAHALVNAVIGYSLARFTDRAFLNVQVGAHYTFG
jgi:hypothetical protein